MVGVPARSMFSLTVKGTPWNGGRSPPPATARSAAFAASSGLLAQDDRDGVDRGVHRLDPPQVGLDDFLTGGLPGSDRLGQVQWRSCARARWSCHAHACPPCCRALRRRTAVAVVAAASRTQRAGAPRCVGRSRGGSPDERQRLPPEIGVDCRRAAAGFAAEDDADACAIPNLERSSRKTYGSCSSSGWSGRPRYERGYRGEHADHEPAAADEDLGAAAHHAPARADRDTAAEAGTDRTAHPRSRGVAGHRCARPRRDAEQLAAAGAASSVGSHAIAPARPVGEGDDADAVVGSQRGCSS